MHRERVTYVCMYIIYERTCCGGGDVELRSSRFSLFGRSDGGNKKKNLPQERVRGDDVQMRGRCVGQSLRGSGESFVIAPPPPKPATIGRRRPRTSLSCWRTPGRPRATYVV